MALPDIVKGTYLDLMQGAGDTDPGPETFAAVCGLTTRGFTQQVNTNDSFIPDCADPEDVPIRRLIPTGEQWDLSGDGYLNLAQIDAIRASVGVTGNWRFVIARPAGSTTGTGYFGGPGMLTNLNIGGSSGDGQFASVSMTLASDGAWAWTPPA